CWSIRASSMISSTRHSSCSACCQSRNNLPRRRPACCVWHNPDRTQPVASHHQLVRRIDGAILFAMSGRRPALDDEAGVITERRTERKLKKPKMYKVLLHNDDYTTMEFVVFILQGIFHRSEADAVQIMLHVHKNGIGVAGVYSYEIAKTRLKQ